MTREHTLLVVDTFALEIFIRALADVPAADRNDVFAVNWALWTEVTRPALEQALTRATER